MIRTVTSFFIKPERRAVGLVFLSISLLFGAWVTRLPELKDRLGLSEGELGVALFFMPLGAISIFPFLSKIIQLLGERKATLLGVLVFLGTILLPSLAASEFWLMASLYLVGVAAALTDVSMNAAAAEVEKQFDCQIMSATHGFFSLGGMIGAATAGLFLWLEVDSVMHLLFWSLLSGSLILLTSGKLLNAAVRAPNTKVFQLPPRSMWGLAVIGLCIMISEGGITDWSTIYLRDELLSSAETAGFGFAGFSAFMALGRFLGDDLIKKYGSGRLLIIGCLMAVLGLGGSMMGHPVLAIAGFSLAGLGYSVIVPILFSRAARVTGVPSATGIASVASAGYLGLLAGPVVIGFIGEWKGLGAGFLFLLLLTALALVVALKRFRS
jgi:MFS family permease